MAEGAAMSERETESGSAGSPASSSWPRRYRYDTVWVVQRDSVAWVHLQWPDGVNVPQQTHRELAECLQELRSDDEVRIVVLRGTRDGSFMSPFAGNEARGHISRPRGGVMSDPKNVFAGLRETADILDALVRMEKPVIAMVNGDALGNGASVAMACDFVFADENAYITDIHIANHYFVQQAKPFTGVVPGDGGTVFWARRLGLAKAKEYLFTGRPVTARELADMNAINAAVPHDELAPVVEEFAGELLQRPGWALAWTKAVANRQLCVDLAVSLDASAALLALSMRVRDEFAGPSGIVTL
jgi:enoyl-CoA hydratase